MSEIKTLLNQSSHYFAAQVIIMLGGFISFPILTRIFSISDYGTLGLLNTSILIATAVAKLGIPESIVRFYAEFKSKNQLTIFHSTFLLTSLAIAMTVVICFILVMRLIGHHFMDMESVNLLALIPVIIFIHCLNTTLTSFLRAEQRTKLLNSIAVMSRYGSLGLSIFLVFFFVRGLYGFYAGQIIAGIIILSLLMYISFRRQKIRIAGFSPSIFREYVRFGFPLAWAEMGYLVLNYADRYLIQLYTGSVSLGLYLAGYNLATYVTEVIIYPINYAMGPIYMKILAYKGEEETKEFLTNALRYFLLIMFPVVFGFIAIGRDLLAVLASSKYVGASIILPYVVIGQAIHACSLILNNGLFIRKKTHLVSLMVSIACFANIGLNIILVPYFGIVGAAQATLISYVFYGAIITYYAFREFSFPVDYPRILLYLVVGIAMYFLVDIIDAGTPIKNLVSKIVTGAVFYSVLVLILDKDLRMAVFRLIKQSRRKNLGLPLR